jgi:hypothetical protein
VKIELKEMSAPHIIGSDITCYVIFGDNGKIDGFIEKTPYVDGVYFRTSMNGEGYTPDELISIGQAMKELK